MNMRDYPTLTDAAFLSSGTIATLTSLKYYAEIEAVQAAFVHFISHAETRFNIWQDAWAAYAAEREVKK